jgi:hypothetical protein
MYGPESENWKASVALGRQGTITRKTKETSIDTTLRLDGGCIRDGIITKFGENVNGLFHGHAQRVPSFIVGEKRNTWHGYINHVFFHCSIDLFEFEGIFALGNAFFEQPNLGLSSLLNRRK